MEAPVHFDMSSYRLKEIDRFAALVLFWAEPRYCSFRQLVHTAHVGDLDALLREIVLVYAQCIDPDQP